MSYGILVTKVDYDEYVNTGDSSIVEEMMCVFVNDDNYTADQKAEDYITYVSNNQENYMCPSGTSYPQYTQRHVRVY